MLNLTGERKREPGLDPKPLAAVDVSLLGRIEGSWDSPLRAASKGCLASARMCLFSKHVQRAFCMGAMNHQPENVEISLASWKSACYGMMS